MEIIGARPRTKWTHSLGGLLWPQMSLAPVHQAARTSKGVLCPTRGAAEHNERREVIVDRAELQALIDELMRRYQDGEIDGETYAREMMELTTSTQE